MRSGRDEPAFAAPVLVDKQFQANEQVGGTMDFVEDDRTRVETQKAFGVLLEYLKCGKVIECEVFILLAESLEEHCRLA